RISTTTDGSISSWQMDISAKKPCRSTPWPIHRCSGAIWETDASKTPRQALAPIFKSCTKVGDLPLATLMATAILTLWSCSTRNRALSFGTKHGNLVTGSCLHLLEQVPIATPSARVSLLKPAAGHSCVPLTAEADIYQSMIAAFTLAWGRLSTWIVSAFVG